MIWLILACEPEVDKSVWNYLPEPTSEPAHDSSLDVDSVLDNFEDGDPITFSGSDPEGDIGPGITVEWIDAAVADENHVVLVGQGGLGVIDIETGEIVGRANGPRGIHVDAHSGVAVMSSRTQQILIYDISDPTNIINARSIENEDIAHEDVAIENGRILVAWHSLGLRIYNTDAQMISSIELDNATTVDIKDNRAVVADNKKILLLDVSDMTAPTILAEASLLGEAFDIAISDGHIAVAMGGKGVQIFRIDETVLEDLGQWIFPGSVQSVSLDGDHLWLSTWKVTAVMNIENEPIVLGHESPKNSSFGVAAINNKAVVADWYYSSALKLNLGVAGAELVMPDQMSFQNESSSNQWLVIENGGKRELKITLEEPTGGFTLEGSGTHAIKSGEKISLKVTSPDNDWGDEEIAWISNDPDEGSGTIKLQPSRAGVGVAHPDFELPIIQWPEGGLGNYRLSESLGKVVFIAWWADF